MSIAKTFSQITRIFDPHQVTVPLYRLPQEKPRFSLTAPPCSLQRATPESVGIRSATIAAFLRAVSSDESTRLQNIIIVKNGSVILDLSFRGYDTRIPKYTYSACKSLVSLVIGVLWDKGILKLTDKIETYLPSSELSPLVRLKIKDLTLEHLLTMSTGSSFGEFSVIAEEDWLHGFLSSSFKGGNDTLFEYNSMNTYLLAHIIRNASGRSLSDWMQECFFEPMGIDNTYWEKCPKGIERGGWGLYIRPEDFAKFGLLLLADGIWKGKRLISKEYLDLATCAHRKAPISCGDFDYGYQIWTGRERNVFLFNGMHGQNVLIDKETNMIFVTNGSNDDMFQQNAYFSYVKEYFFQSKRPLPSTLPDSPRSRKALEIVIESILPHPLIQNTEKKSLLSRILKRPEPKQELVYFEDIQMITEKRYSPNPDKVNTLGLLPNMFQVTQGCYSTGLVSIAFQRKDQDLLLEWTEKEQKHRLLLGFMVPKISEIEIDGAPFAIGADFHFARDEYDQLVLMIRIDMLEMPYSRSIKFRFLKKGSVEMTLDETPSADFLLGLSDNILADMKTKPIIGPALTKLDPDYLDFLVRRVMQPKIQLESSSVL